MEEEGGQSLNISGSAGMPSLSDANSQSLTPRCINPQQFKRRHSVEAEDKPALPANDNEMKMPPQWMASYNELKAFRAENGHLRVPSPKPLAQWAWRQRSSQKSGNLPLLAKRFLDELEFDWGPHKTNLTSQWMASYNELKAFRAENGHLRVPLATCKPLAQWAWRQRSSQKSGNLPFLAKRFLDELEFDWGPHEKNLTSRDLAFELSHVPPHGDDCISPRWMETYRELEVSYAQHGHLRCRSLANWSSEQRRCAKSRNFPTEKKRLLDDIGFCWNNECEPVETSSVIPATRPESSNNETFPRREAWLAKYNALNAFKALNGHFPSTSNHPLVAWMSQQRYRAKNPPCRHNVFHPRKRELLDAIGFDWSNQSLPAGETVEGRSNAANCKKRSASATLLPVDERSANASTKTPEMIEGTWARRFRKKMRPESSHSEGRQQQLTALENMRDDELSSTDSIGPLETSGGAGVPADSIEIPQSGGLEKLYTTSAGFIIRDKDALRPIDSVETPGLYDFSPDKVVAPNTRNRGKLTGQRRDKLFVTPEGFIMDKEDSSIGSTSTDWVEIHKTGNSGNCAGIVDKLDVTLEGGINGSPKSIQSGVDESWLSADDDSQSSAESVETLRKTHLSQLNRKAAFNPLDPRTLYKDEDPPPQLLMHGAWEDEDSDSEVDETTSKQESLDKLQERFPRDEDFQKLARKYSQKKLQQDCLTKHFQIPTNTRLSLENIDQELDEARKTLGYPSPLKHPQAAVCRETVSSPNSDIVFVAPCGFGKSVCFTIPALLSGGITLVIEPYKALIESQLDNIRGMVGIEVEKLFRHDETQGGGKRLSAALRLHHLTSHTNAKPMIIFGTPELVTLPGSLQALTRLSEQGRLKRIVVDEFDVIEDAADGYRTSYLELFPMLRQHCRYRERAIQIVALSATVTKSALLASRKSADSASEAKLFLAERALPDWHAYRVERKKSDKQVATRIVRILEDYKAQHGLQAKSVCFCLRRDSCKKMASLLQEHGVMAEVLDSQTNQDGRTRDIVARFRRGETQVLCATKALGRGFHDFDIRFIFHTLMPLSLRDYIQETGRGGRDFKQAVCVLFFSLYDKSKGETVVGLLPNRGKFLQGDDRKRAEADLRQVVAYAFNGKECRYSLLAKFVALDDVQEGKQSCAHGHSCDNCFVRKEKPGVVACTNHCILDNINIRQSLTLGQRDISDIVADCLSKVSGLSKSHSSKGEEDVVKHIKDDLSKQCDREMDPSQKPFLIALIRNPGDPRKTLVHELVRSLRSDSTAKSVESRAVGSDGHWNAARTNWRKVQSIVDSIRNGKVKIFVRNVWLPKAKEQVPSKVMDLELADNYHLLAPNNTGKELDANRNVEDDQKLGIPRTWLVGGWFYYLSFLFQFELKRLLESPATRSILWQIEEDVRNLVDRMAKDHAKTFDIFKELQERLEPRPSLKSYLSTLADASEAGLPVDETPIQGSFGNGSALYFHATLESNGKLSLLPPERAFERRLFRKFGSHRFLHVNVSKNVPETVRDSFFGTSRHLCGRQWSHFWCKTGKSPQCYVLFAEKGVGIEVEEERTVRELWEWCIPRDLNPDITVGKFNKRLKLAHSKTTAAGVLPKGSVEILPEVRDVHNIADFDGCGLISRECLDFVWTEYCKAEQSRKLPADQDLDFMEISKCPHTGFQGRLGGFKGAWVLDESLGEGIKMQVRPSQHKHKLPQKCLVSLADEEILQRYDPFYDTVEVCGWDNPSPLPSTLNIRLVQLLEAAGVPEELFLKFVDASTKYLSCLSKNPDSLLRDLADRRGTMADRPNDMIFDPSDNTDSNFVFLASLANVETNEPVLVEKRKRLVENIFERMRSKAHYRIPSSCYVRMYPDHTLLLEEGEAFLAHNEALGATEVVGMRSPSYFAGDLRKLKLVDAFTLEQRAGSYQEPKELPQALRRTPEQRLRFFRNVRNAIILSARGKQSEAGKMSGGDYDGDMAWTCWNEELVSHVQPPEAHDNTRYTVPKQLAEQKVFWETSTQDRLGYFFNFRFHQRHLGDLSVQLDKCIDEYGFNHEVTTDVGRAAFLQVDEPYERVKLRGGIDLEMIRAKKQPHWKGHPTPAGYQSRKVLGKIWDHLEQKFACAVSAAGEPKPDEHIILYINKSRQDELVSDKELSSMRIAMKDAVARYSQESFQICVVEPRGKEAYLRWHEHFCKTEARKLILNKPGMDRQCLAAAVLYEQAANRGVSALKFAWGAAVHYLCRIAGDAAGEKTGSTRLPLLMANGKEKVVFGRR